MASRLFAQPFFFRCRSKKTSKLRVTGLCEGNPVTGGFPSQRTSYAENASIWWRHHVTLRPEQNGHHIAWRSFQIHLLDKKCVLIKILIQAARTRKGPMEKKQALILVIAWCGSRSDFCWESTSTKEQYCVTFVLYLLLAWTNCWTDIRIASGFRCRDTHVSLLQIEKMQLTKFAVETPIDPFKPYTRELFRTSWSSFSRIWSIRRWNAGSHA